MIISSCNFKSGYANSLYMQMPDCTNNIKTMLSALLERSIQDYFNTKKANERRQAKQWIFEDSEEDLIFNFPYVCDILGICHITLKNKIIKYEKQGFEFTQRNRSSDGQTLEWFNNNDGNGYTPVLHSPKQDK